MTGAAEMRREGEVQKGLEENRGEGAGAGDRLGSGNRKRDLAPANVLPLDLSRSRNRGGAIQQPPPPRIKRSNAKRVDPAESRHRKTRGPMLLELLFPKCGRGTARTGKGMIDHPPISPRS